MEAANPIIAGMKTGVQTHERRYVDPLDLDPCNVSIEDIAYSLSNIARWTGHADRSALGDVYTVAQHSVLVALRARSHKLAALLHDAAEYLLADLARPLKVNSDMGVLYKGIENDLAERIEVAFRVPAGDLDHPDVKEADTDMLLIEARWLMGDPDWAQAAMPPDALDMRAAVDPWPHVKAEYEFLKLYRELSA